MTDNTQELDEILDSLMEYSHSYGKGDIPSSENPPLIEARKAKQALLDWHNKQIEAVLDRLQYELDNYLAGNAGERFRDFVEAERNKLKESSND